MNQYPLWKYLLIALIVIVGVIYALPNLYGEDPAIQISPARSVKLDDSVQRKVLEALEKGGITPKRTEYGEQRMLLRFADTEVQLEANDLVRDALGPGYTVALNLAPATPGWLQSLNALPMYLGLDLRGGVHFLMEVDMATALSQALERYLGDFRTALREAKLRYLTIEREGDHVAVKFRDAQQRDAALKLFEGSADYSDLQFSPVEREGGYYLHAVLRDTAQREIRRFALQQNITTLRNRVNELGVAEPLIQQQGQERIVVQLPGVQDTARAKEILGAVATLEFRMVDERGDVQAAVAGRVPPGSRLYHERNGRPILLKKQIIITGDYITDASSGIEQQTGSPAVFITLDGKGARMMSNATRDNIGRSMAVVFIELKSETRMVDGKPVKSKKKVEEVINVAVIRDQLGKRFQISGLDSTREARDLALLLRAGSLAAPIEIVEERTIGPSLGQDNIDKGVRSVVIGFVLVLAFMAFWYRGFGLMANLALTLNLVLIVALLSMLQATLTLPGIAGIVLTVGMAVDANVLIFERIREELRNGNSPQSSIDSGYAKAFSTIADANITTLIAALVLFGFGTGPIKGFAVTLSLGIVTSMFTAIMVTRAVANLIYGRQRRLAKLSI
ncbi:MAG TPA: protein translocase subunit SecD [Gammaproteobacteria bacterium]|nr:protein translocase subunit SecD [Gammaproteobacteria bacterium]